MVAFLGLFVGFILGWFARKYYRNSMVGKAVNKTN